MLVCKTAVFISVHSTIIPKQLVKIKSDERLIFKTNLCTYATRTMVLVRSAFIKTHSGVN